MFGKSAKFDIIVPYAHSGERPRLRYAARALRHRLRRPGVPLLDELLGAPALTAAEFKDYRQDLILGASLRIIAPLGQYDGDKLVNIGTNRWSFKPEIGCSKAFGRWTVECARRHFLHGQRRFLRWQRRAGRRFTPPRRA